MPSSMDASPAPPPIDVSAGNFKSAGARSIALIPGTIATTSEIDSAVRWALREEEPTSADVYAVTDIYPLGDDLFVSVVGLQGITDVSQWNIEDNGAWFGLVLLVPLMTLGVRRLHDCGNSGRLVWIAVIGFGALIVATLFDDPSKPVPAAAESVHSFGPLLKVELLFFSAWAFALILLLLQWAAPSRGANAYGPDTRPERVTLQVLDEANCWLCGQTKEQMLQATFVRFDHTSKTTEWVSSAGFRNSFTHGEIWNIHDIKVVCCRECAEKVGREQCRGMLAASLMIGPIFAPVVWFGVWAETKMSMSARETLTLALVIAYAVQGAFYLALWGYRKALAKLAGQEKLGCEQQQTMMERIFGDRITDLLATCAPLFVHRYGERCLLMTSKAFEDFRKGYKPAV